MAIIRWEPFGGVATLQDRVNRIFEDAFPGYGKAEEDLSLCAWRPMVDIYETRDGLVVKAELPGVKKEDVSVEVKDNVLTLKGERKADSDVSDEKFYCRERCFGTFQRSFSLDYPVDPERINARFKDGVLEIAIAKPEKEIPKQITVNIE
jgi:HSP20 family protein